MKVFNERQRELLQRFKAKRLNDIEFEQVKDLLRRFVRGDLEEAESTDLIDLLAENDESMTLLDESGTPLPVEQTFAGVPPLDEAAAARLLTRLMNRIQQSGKV